MVWWLSLIGGVGVVFGLVGPVVLGGIRSCSFYLAVFRARGAPPPSVKGVFHLFVIQWRWPGLASLSTSVPGKFSGIVGQDPSDFKSNQLHVDIFRFCCSHLRYILQIPLK